MSYAVGVREDMNAKDSQIVMDYINENVGKIINLSSGESVDFLKGDVKIKDDKAVLIYRYQLIQK
jgi:hypothetical protein